MIDDGDSSSGMATVAVAAVEWQRRDWDSDDGDSSSGMATVAAAAAAARLGQQQRVVANGEGMWNISCFGNY